MSTLRPKPSLGGKVAPRDSPMHNAEDCYLMSAVTVPVRSCLAGSRDASLGKRVSFKRRPAMPKSITRSRAAAFDRQNGRCYYCDHPMWLSDVRQYSLQHHLSIVQARHFRCTAEHLLARCDGGGNSRSNIVAACWTCNKRRHARGKPLAPSAFRHHVQCRLRRGRWHALPPNNALLSDAYTSPLHVKWLRSDLKGRHEE